MRAVIQRVTNCVVHVKQQVASEIETGFLVLLGIENEDGEEDIEWLIKKIVNLRVFNDSNQVMNKSIIDVKGSILVVSQFTLYASTKKGNRPSYIKAAKPDTAIPIYEEFLKRITSTKVPIKTGVFGADMKVSLVNDGPVTILLDTKNKD